MDYKSVNDNEILYMISDHNSEEESYIYEKYKPIVLAVAKKYYKTLNHSVIDLDDLIQSGYIALNNAIKNYESDKNVLFYTFALHCIQREIKNAVYRSNIKYDHNSAFSSSLDERYNNQILSDTPSLIDVKLLEDEIYNFSLDLDFDSSSVFLLKINGFTYKEISILLDLKFKKVDYIIQKCKNKLKKTLIV